MLYSSYFVSACLWTLTTLKGTFSSPYYPQNYNDMASCTWHINVPWNYTISLTFNDFSAERRCCHCDYVEVWEIHANGSAVLNNKFCDQRKPDLFKPLNFSSNNVTVVFHSDSTITGKGFQASYEAIPVAGKIVRRSVSYTFLFANIVMILVMKKQVRFSIVFFSQ